MKLVSYLKEEQEQLAVLVDGLIYDMERFHPDMPNNINLFLNYWEELLPLAQAGELAVRDGHIGTEKGMYRRTPSACSPPSPFPHPAATATPSASTSPPPAATGACP